MANLTKPNDEITLESTPTGEWLHQLLSLREKELFRRENHKIWRKTGRLHPRNGKPTTGEYVSMIFDGKKQVNSELAKAISKSLDRAIRRAWEKNPQAYPTVTEQIKNSTEAA